MIVFFSLHNLILAPIVYCICMSGYTLGLPRICNTYVFLGNPILYKYVDEQVKKNYLNMARDIQLRISVWSADWSHMGFHQTFADQNGCHNLGKWMDFLNILVRRLSSLKVILKVFRCFGLADGAKHGSGEPTWRWDQSSDFMEKMMGASEFGVWTRWEKYVELSESSRS